MAKPVNEQDRNDNRNVKHKQQIAKEKLTDFLQAKLFDDDYIFTASEFEPTNDKPIDEDKLTDTKFQDELVESYFDTFLKPLDTEKNKIRYEKYNFEKPWRQCETIVKILDANRAEYLINLNKSEYFKVLTHFTLLSVIKNGWYNLFITYHTRKTKPSLSDNPSNSPESEIKKLNDAIIRCFYSRLIIGMSEQEKKRYPLLLPGEYLPTHFGKLLCELDESIQYLCCLLEPQFNGNDERLLPGENTDLVVKRCAIKFNFCRPENIESYKTDTLRATLIKCATLNHAINDIEAIIIIYDEIIDCLLNDIEQLIPIESESEILPAISHMFPNKKRKLPSDLIKCAKLMCKMYIITSQPATNIGGFNALHMDPWCIAISAAILFSLYDEPKAISFNINGLSNPDVKVYRRLSQLANNVKDINTVTVETLYINNFPQELFKFLTTLYSITINSFSDYYPNRQCAEAHLNYRKRKLELQEEIYECLKEVSVNDAVEWIVAFCNHVTSMTPKSPS